MSIILDALKKTSKEEADVTAETKKGASESESKSTLPQTSNPDALHLNRPTIIAVTAILSVGTLLYLSYPLLRGPDIQTEKYPTPKTETPNLKSTPAQNLSAEGYSPPQAIPKPESTPLAIFKHTAFNPKLTLNGIIYGFDKPTAIIDNKILEEGQSIRGAKVVKIHRDRVELLNESSGEIFVLKLH